jgi:hypothetical protein
VRSSGLRGVFVQSVDVYTQFRASIARGEMARMLAVRLSRY